MHIVSAHIIPYDVHEYFVFQKINRKMADTSPKKKVAAKPKKPAAHPKYSEMVGKAIAALKERGGFFYFQFWRGERKYGIGTKLV
jgi:hypothetical protein